MSAPTFTTIPGATTTTTTVLERSSDTRTTLTRTTPSTWSFIETTISETLSEPSNRDQRVRICEEWLDRLDAQWSVDQDPLISNAVVQDTRAIKRCFRCKATNHVVQQCPTRRQCKTCGKRHATKDCKAIQRSLKEEEALADWVRKPMKEVCWACVDQRQEDWGNDFFDVPMDGRIIVDYDECSHSYFWA
ncbi:hypothetical protein EI94DRAFT_1813791 [Lactarius quietus]|nr:hypothetical protein EI94DRAFT_1813791 [Lactarius quietus]